MTHKEFMIGIKPFSPSGGKIITHLLYIDDLLLFANGGVWLVRKNYEHVEEL